MLSGKRKILSGCLLLFTFAFILWIGALVVVHQMAPTPGVIDARIETGQYFMRDIAVNNNQLLVASSGRGVPLRAYSYNGEANWEFFPDPRPHKDCNISGYGISSLEVADDGTIYAGGGDGVLYALDQAGILLWKYDTAPVKRTVVTPFIHQNGNVYTIDCSGNLSAFTNEGALIVSSTETQNVLWNQPIEWDGENRFRYADTGSNSVICKDDAGIEIWKLALPGQIFELAYAPDGVVYAQADTELYCISADGLVSWHKTIGEFVIPAIDELGNVYLPDRNSLMVLSPDGNLLRKIPGSRYFYHEPYFANGKIYVEKTLNQSNALTRFIGYSLNIWPDNKSALYCFDTGGNIEWVAELEDRAAGLVDFAFDDMGNVFVPRMDATKSGTGIFKTYILKIHGP